MNTHKSKAEEETESSEGTDELSNSLATNKNNSSTKYRLNPIILTWAAIILIFLDYIVFQKPIPKFLSWLLLVTPAILLAVSFWIWAKRKIFPFFSFPFNPMISGNLTNNEGSNVFHAILMLIMCIAFIIFITYLFLFK